MSENIKYLKMNGLGNDFVVLDSRQQVFDINSDQVRWIADREQGIGCDQLIIIDPPKSAQTDIFMRIFNHDGGEVAACGNATRCVGALLAKETSRNSFVIETKAGIICANVDGKIVTVDMGKPKFDWQSIPLSEEFGDTRGIELQIGPIDDPVLHTPSVVNVGNPHAIFWVDKDPNEYDLARFGPMLENHPVFPERANITLARVLSDNEVKIIVWERGVGLTLACGTAACAVVAAGVRKKLFDRKITVNLPGGDLELEWRQSDDHILMSGPWSLDGEGEISLVSKTVGAN